MKNHSAKRYNPRMAQLTGGSVPVSEAARLTGLSVRTVKRMCAAGQLSFFRSPGGHVRVVKADLERFLRRASPALPPASSVLQNRRERVEELGLEAQELRAKREIEKLRKEDSEAERGRTMEARAQVLAQRRALEETRLQRERDAEQRERQRREAAGEGERAEFFRRWLRWAADSFPDWLSAEQTQSVTVAVERALEQCDPGEPDGDVRPVLERAIERLLAPCRAEREERARRERLIEHAVWGLPWGAIDADKARAVGSARTALSRLPLGATDAEVQVALDEAVAPTRQAIEERQTRARREQLIEAAGRWLPWDATDADKAKAAAAVRSVLSNLPLRASQTEEQNAVSVAVAPIKQLTEERTAARQHQEQRERKKSTLLTLAIFHASNYLDTLHNDGDMELDSGEDFDDVRRDVEAAVRKALEEELTGDESHDEANRIARQVVDEELE